MAFGGTHLRFAIDMKDRYGITDMQKYLSGALYPDSRMFTHVERLLTHPTNLADSLFYTTDFRKGWHTHLLCDVLQSSIMREWFPEICEETREHNGEVWLKLTAIKMVQDLGDVHHVNASRYLPLEYVEAHFGENPDVLRKSNVIFTAACHHPDTYDIEESLSISRQLGMPESVIEELRRYASIYLKDDAVMEKIARIYPEIIRLAVTYPFKKS